MGAMLFAHWLYLIGGGLSLFVTEHSQHEADYAMKRLQRSYAPGTAGHHVNFVGPRRASSDPKVCSSSSKVGFAIPEGDESGNDSSDGIEATSPSATEYDDEAAAVLPGSRLTPVYQA